MSNPKRSLDVSDTETATKREKHEYGCAEVDITVFSAVEKGRKLLLAATVGDTATISLLLDDHVDINFKDCDTSIPVHMRQFEASALLLAVRSRKISTATFLLEHGADVNAADSEGHTPLYCAVAFWDKPMVDLLVSHKADPNVVKKDGISCLYAAAMKSNIEAINTLLDLGADINAADEEGNTALHVAASSMHDRVLTAVNILLDRGAPVDGRNNAGETALHLAAATSYSVDVVRLLLDRGFSVNACTATGKTPLHFAAPRFSIDVVVLLVDRGADASARNCRNEKALHCAEKAARPKDRDKYYVLRCVLDKDFPMDVEDEEGRTLLQRLLNKRDIENAVILVSRGASISAKDLAHLQLCASKLPASAAVTAVMQQQATVP